MDPINPALKTPALETNALPQSQSQSELDEVTLRVNEIFFSIQGETSRTGIPTLFIRLTGCPLRCGYCDTAYAFHQGKTMTLREILQAISGYASHFVTVTGGEPLAQKNCLVLLRGLCDQRYSVSLETSGAIDISDVDDRVARIVDIKTPASGEVDKNRWQNLDRLRLSDEVKFVLCDHNDYEWAKTIIENFQLTKKCPVLFSPAHATLSPQRLAEWILGDALPVRMQVQLHKYLWGDVPGR